MKSFLVAVALLIGASAHAKIKIISVTGASGVQVHKNNLAVFGGTNSNCTSALTACNQNPIDAFSTLTINFMSDKSRTGVATIESDSQTAVSSNGTTVTESGQVATVRISWSQLCSGSPTADATCYSPFTSTFQLGINSSGTNVTWGEGDDRTTLVVSVIQEITNTVDDCTINGAICNFWAMPGKKGIHLTDLSTASGFPGSYGYNVSAIKVYVSKSGWDKANPTDRDFEATIPVRADGTYNQFIPRFEKNQTMPYYFRVASQDIAGNVFNFTSDANIKNSSYGNCTAATGSTAAPPMIDSPKADGCRYVVFPKATH
jgi:hypothetical protein